MGYRYPIEVLESTLEKGIQQGILKRPVGDIWLAEALASLDELLASAMEGHGKCLARIEHERLRPVKAENAEQIPFSGNSVLFIDTADRPCRTVLWRIMRCEFEPEVICFIGESPEWVSELTMTGHRVYEMPAGTKIAKGRRALKPYQSSLGVMWIEISYDETLIQLN